MHSARTGDCLTDPKNALCTGIGYVNFLRNWDTSIAGVLEV